jgi:hypothetical protein
MHLTDQERGLIIAALQFFKHTWNDEKGSMPHEVVELLVGVPDEAINNLDNLCNKLQKGEP